MERFKEFVSHSFKNAYLAVVYHSLLRNQEIIIKDDRLFDYLMKRFFFTNRTEMLEIATDIKNFRKVLNDENQILNISISTLPHDILNHLLQTVIILYPVKYYQDGYLETLNQKVGNSGYNDISFLKEVIRHDLNRPRVIKYADDSV